MRDRKPLASAIANATANRVANRSPGVAITRGDHYKNYNYHYNCWSLISPNATREAAE